MGRGVTVQPLRMEAGKEMTYKAKYGGWAGNEHGRVADLTRCCVEVTRYENGWPRNHQCNRKRGHGPDGEYCKQHDPAAVAERNRASHEKHDAAWQIRRKEIAGPRMFKIIEQIANGHNDACSLAREFLEGFRK